MALSSDERRALRAQSNALRATVRVGKAGVTEGLVRRLRTAFDGAELVKVAVERSRREQIDEIAGLVALRAACELVGRIGFVLLFCSCGAGNGGTGAVEGDSPGAAPL